MSEAVLRAGVDVQGKKAAPFLVWPVGRREFYLTVQFALLPTMLWGVVVFGWRVLILWAGATAACSVVHTALYRLTRRGKRLVLAHSVTASFVMVALCYPMWPAWLAALAGAMIPVMFWILGGPGRERIHIAVVGAIVLQVVVGLMPAIGMSSGTTQGILARDRLLMGDIRNFGTAPVARWPSSVELGGDDAVTMERPRKAALDAMDRVSEEMSAHPAAFTSVATTTNVSGGFRARLDRLLDPALATRLPSVEALMVGAVPGRIGTVSLAAILLGGLYLAYRHILRSLSVSVFFITYLLSMGLLVFWPTTVASAGVAAVFHVWRAIPGELLTLLGYAVGNSDVAFATVFILALPGTEPLSPRGRRVFLALAGVAAAALDRLNLPIPAATVALCLLMPLAPMFDWLFARRSWLTGVY